MKSLKDDGTISRFTIERGKEGNSNKIKAYLTLKYETHNAQEIFKEILSTPCLYRFELLFGEFDALATYYVDRISILDEIRVTLHNLDGVQSIHTLIQQREMNDNNINSIRSKTHMGGE